MLDARYFQSLSMELTSLKNRVRSFIQNRHWQTDGEWKESVIRTLLRRHLPISVQIGRGFVITDEKPTKQIDILLYDADKPILFRDGDLVFVTPDAVIGMIEVKTTIDNSSFKKALSNLSSNAYLVQSKSARKRVYGLFSFEDKTTNIKTTLNSVQKITNASSNRVVHCICLGESSFIRFWNLDPTNEKRLADKWHAYELTKMAPGYFIHSIIEEIYPQSIGENKALWYPKEGKEGSKIGEINLRDT